MRGLSREERTLMQMVDGPEPMSPYSPHDESVAQGLLARGLMVRVEPWARPGMGDDVTEPGRLIMSVSQ